MNSPNSGCLIDIRNGPPSGPSIYNGTNGCKAAKGRIVAHHCVERPISGIWWIYHNCRIYWHWCMDAIYQLPLKYQRDYGVNSPNSGCILTIGNGPQMAQQCVLRTLCRESYLRNSVNPCSLVHFRLLEHFGNLVHFPLNFQKC